MIDENKAYVLGLLVGGGTISPTTFHINLPFKSWGTRVNNIPTIANDILIDVRGVFRKAYGLDINFQQGNNRSWTILPVLLSNKQLADIKSDLIACGLPSSGSILANADLSTVMTSFSNNVSELFLAGVFDTRGSVEPSQRRFGSDAPTVSLEIPGSTENFKFVIQICSWMHRLGTTTDQILFNHPAQQAAHDAYYTGWKKGFKIRFLVSSFLGTHSFVFKSKAHSANQLLRKQTIDEQPLCEHRDINTPSPVCIHHDIKCSELPLEVRGRLFYHYLHYCAVLGCPYAPKNKIQQLARQYRSATSVCTLLTKGVDSETDQLYLDIQQRFFPTMSINKNVYTVSSLLNSQQFQKYNKLEVALAYLFSPRLMGKRNAGAKDVILNNSLSKRVAVYSPGQGYPIHIVNEANHRSAILSSISSVFNQTLLAQEVSASGIIVECK